MCRIAKSAVKVGRRRSNSRDARARTIRNVGRNCAERQNNYYHCAITPAYVRAIRRRQSVQLRLLFSVVCFFIFSHFFFLVPLRCLFSVSVVRRLGAVSSSLASFSGPQRQTQTRPDIGVQTAALHKSAAAAAAASNTQLRARASASRRLIDADEAYRACRGALITAQTPAQYGPIRARAPFCLPVCLLRGFDCYCLFFYRISYHYSLFLRLFFSAISASDQLSSIIAAPRSVDSTRSIFNFCIMDVHFFFSSAIVNECSADRSVGRRSSIGLCNF